MLISRSSSSRAIRLRTVVSVISSDRAISVLDSRPSAWSILMIRRSRSSTRRARARTGGSVSSGPVLAITRLIIGPQPARPSNPGRRAGPRRTGATVLPVLTASTP